MLNELERNHLIAKYKTLLGLCRPYMRKGDTSPVRKAFDIALEACEGFRTYLDEPAIYHSLDLSSILAVEIGLGKASIISALLQDPYFKNRIAPKTITQNFDSQVLNILDGLKKLSGIHTEKTSIHSENFIKLFLSIAKDIRVLLIKLADTLYHIRIIDHLPDELKIKFVNEAYYLYAPVAHRLGLYHIKSEMEDQGMRFLFKEQYNLISNKIKETKTVRSDFIQKFIKPIESELIRQGFDFEIKGRPKSVHSIWEKMEKQKVSFEEVYDLLAIRIILKSIKENEKADCWKVYSIVTDIYPPNTSRLRDWISAPKASGYESLHTTVTGPGGKTVEVQIRTARMDEIAEKGHAAHWKYKETKNTTDTEGWMRDLRDLLENPDSNGLDQEHQSKMEGLDDHIFIFTPKGDLKQLITGATVLDFAFDIHTNIGMKCTGAKVNGKIVPIKHVLQNGDEVDIITAKNQKPKTDWLNIVVAPRNKSKIKRALKEESYKEAEIGKDTLGRKLKNWKVPFTDENIEKIIKALRFKTPIDLYNAISTEKIEMTRIKEVLIPSPKPDLVPVHEAEVRLPAKKAEPRNEDYISLDQNLAGINYTLATCCNPIFGDEVFGFVTISKGITIHRTSCPNATDMKNKFDYRIINVKWRESAKAGAFQTTIRLTGIDDLGIVNSISDIISNDMKVNMRSLSIDTHNGVFEGTIKLFVSDTKTLEMMLHKLLRVKGVMKATRMD